MSGWIKVHRKVQDHWIFKEQREFSRFEAWLDILLCANHSEQKVIIQGTVYTVKQGESLHSLETWAKRWNWSKTKVRRFFDTLTKELMIETTNETKTTRLTICNYASYQVERNADETTKKRRRNADETQTAPNKNEENDNNDKQTYYRVINHLKITEEEFTSLSADYSKQQIDDVLDQIENYKNNKNYVSLYLTAKNWLKKESKKQDTKVSTDPLVIEMKRQMKMYGLE